MNKAGRIIITSLVVALAVTVSVLVSGSASSHRHGIACADVDIRVPQEQSFVSEQDVKDYLRKNYGAYIGERIDSLDLRKMESVLDSRSAIRKSQAWTTQDGILHIKITQREPSVRFQKGSHGYYADDRGYIFPLQKTWEAPVPVVEGNLPLEIPEGYCGEPLSESDAQWISGVLDLLGQMSRSKFWTENLKQLSVSERGDLVIIPLEGRERFILGDSSRPEEKLSLVEDYYKYIQPSKDPGTYATVNVKYPGQIICRKK